jgi:hypothetical protein
MATREILLCAPILCCAASGSPHRAAADPLEADFRIQVTLQGTAPYALTALAIVLVGVGIGRRLRSPHILARLGAAKRLGRLLKRQTDAVHARDSGGETPLMYASKYNEPATTSLLLAAGADPNVSCRGGGTALMLAAGYGCSTTVSLLLDAGAEVNAKDEAGVTPLHLAAAGGYAEVVASLLKAGADATRQDVAGKTPSEVAMAAGFDDLANAITGRAEPL